MNKNPGRKLFFSRFGGETPIPPEFIAAMEREEEVQPVPNEVGPEKLSDTIIESEVKTDRDNERVRKTVKKKPGNVGPLLFIHTDEHGRPVQASRLLVPTGSVLSTQVNAYTTIARQDLGNGWSIDEVAIEGTYLPNGTFLPGIFPGYSYKSANPSAIPQEFTADIPTITTHIDEQGTVVSGVLLPSGDVSHEETQISQNKKRTTIEHQDVPTAPQVRDRFLDTNNEKQVVTETHTWDEETVPAPVPTAIRDVRAVQHGDGKRTVVTRDVETLFKAKSFVAEIPDNIPPEFRTANATKTTEELFEGIAGPPFLSTHEIAKRETQVNDFVKRVQTTSRITTLGTAVVEHRIDGISDNRGSFFDGDVVRARSLANSSAADTETFLTLDSQVRALGGTPDFPGGVWERATSVIEAFPPLFGSTVDLDTGVRTNITKTIIQSDTVVPPPAYASRFPLNKKRTLQIEENFDATALLAVGFVMPSTTNVDLPVQLLSVSGYIASTQQIGFYSETGSYTIAGQGSGGISLHGNATGSSAVIPDADYQIKQIWGSNIPCIHYVFYLPHPVTVNGVITKVNNIIGGGVTVGAWPRFAPKALSIIMVGQHVSGTAQVGASASDSIHTDYTGAIVHGGSIRTAGSGASLEINTSVKVLRVPPTIHGALTITNDQGSVAVLASCDISNGATAASRAVSATALGVIVNALNNTTTIPATPSGNGFLNTIPNTGLYIHRIQTEIYKYGYIKVLAEVVDFSLINPSGIS